MADGSYTSHIFSTAVSGSTYITVKKATIADHGTETGWSNSFGDGQAVLADSIQFTSSYWIFDGNGTHTVPSSNSADYGFKVLKTVSSWMGVIKIGNGSSAISNITIKYTHSFNTYHAKNVVSSDTINVRFYGYAGGKHSYIKIQNNFLENSGQDGIQTSGANYLLFERNYMKWLGELGAHLPPLPDYHGQTFSNYPGGGADVIYRYNVFESCEGEALISIFGPSGTPARIRFYGNLIYNPYGAYTASAGYNAGIVHYWAEGANPPDGLYFYNNTVVNSAGTYDLLDGVGHHTPKSMWLLDSSATNAYLYNNLLYDSHTNITTGWDGHGYHASGGGDAAGGTNEQTGLASTIFTNYTGNDFRLTSNTTAGLNLTAQPWWNGGTDSFFGSVDSAADAYGVTRVTWSRGAYEYASGSGPTPVNGSCGTTQNSCATGTFSDIADSSANYLWSCLGSSGGTTASCSLPIPSTPINGVCGITLNACAAGVLSDIADTAALYLWNCAGSNGGTTAACSLSIPSTKFSLNDRIQISASANVFATPSVSGAILGYQAVGSLGTVIGGPTSSGGYNWWNINYDAGVDGWSIENYLSLYVAPAGNGLVAWYQFDEGSGATVVDSSATGNNGTVIGNPVRVAGMSGNALSFNGFGDYVRVPYNTAVKIGKRTVAVWLKTADFLKSTTIAGWNYGLNDGGGVISPGCGDSNRVGIISSTGAVGWTYANAAGVRIFPSPGYFGGSGIIKLGEWAHYVFTFDTDASGNDTFKLYKNGVLIGTDTSRTDGLSENCAFRQIGSQEDPSNIDYIRTFSGLMDDFRIYNRALTQDEVTGLYNIFRPSSGDTTAPTIPSSVTAVKDSTLSSSKINISWTASTDASGVAGYIIYRSTTLGGTYLPIASVTGTSYSDTVHTNGGGFSFYYTLAQGGTYYYKIAAYDAAYNVSAQSAVSSGATLDTTSGTYTITVNRIGTSLGTAVSSPTGISCGATCSYSFNRETTVNLEGFPWSVKWPEPFNGWGGDCASAGTGQCLLYMTGDKSVTAYYGSAFPSALITYTLSVSHAGTGGGTITSSSAGISCASGTCSASFSMGTFVTLSASPLSGSVFAGWSGGGCSGTGTCVVSSAASVTATFNTSSPAQVNGSCGTTLNSCAPGALFDIADTATLYLWNCAGSNGGTTAACSLPRPSAKFSLNDRVQVSGSANVFVTPSVSAAILG